MGSLVMAEFGDVVLAAGGLYSSKPRPVLVFQNDAWSTGESTVVIPFTSHGNTDAHYRVPVSAQTGNGLDRPCWLEVDKIGAIRTAWLGARVGRLEEESLRACAELVRELLSPGPQVDHPAPGPVHP